MFQDIFRETRIKLAANLKTMAKISDKLKAIVNHQGFRKYFVNTSWLFSEQILRIVAGLFVGIYVARYLGPERFGIFSYVLAFVALFTEAARLGLGGILIRNLANYPEKRDDYLGTAFWLQMIGAILALGVVAIAVQFTNNDPKTNFYIFIISSGIIFQSFEVVDSYFQSKVLSKYVSVCKIVQLVFSSILKLYFVFIKADLSWFVILSAIDQIFLAVALVFAYWRQNIGTFLSHFKLDFVKIMLKDSWPLMISGFATILLLRIDQVMIKEMIGAEAVGQYAAAVKLSDAWFFVPMIITGSLFPAIINAKKTSEKLYYSRFIKLYSLMAWISISIALVMTFFSNWLVLKLYGASYSQAGQVLVILLWSGVFVFLGTVNKRWFLVENLQHLLLFRICLGAASNVFLNILMIPAYGIKGAALATLISYALTYYISNLFNKESRALFVLATKGLHPKYIIEEWK